MSAARFVHLRLHTEYSLQDSVVRIPELVERAAALGMPAVAVTDQHNLFAMVKFYREGLKRGVKPIIGVDVLVRAARGPHTRLTLLCKDPRGYQNVANLVTRAWLEGQEKGVPLIDRAWLTSATTAGLIALSGAAEGDVGRTLAAGRAPDALTIAREWQQLFGDRYYLELQRLGRPDDESNVAKTVALAHEAGIPVVATNDVRFLAAEDFESHEARVCIADGAQLADPSRPRKYTGAQYLRSPAEMERLFADIPEALRNTVEIARRCSLPLKLGESRLPIFPLPEGVSVEAHIREESLKGFEFREKTFDAVQRARLADYRTRLDVELGVIGKMGFSGYFLIVADFIRWARANDVPVGPGRGSGAGSLVAYSLGITDIDPLKYDLLFERFLNPERVSMPDFDVDFCMDGRDRVIEYVSQKYGRERVSQIITYGTMAAKAVVRDCGRVLGMGYGYVDKIAKLIPFELGITLDDAIEKEPELKRLYKEDEEIKNLLDLAKSLEGLTRNAGMHAGGVVIAPSTLTEFAPLYADDKGGSVVTQFDKDDVEAAGLVKFDFLGLRTLTVIDRAVKLINARRAASGEAPLDISALPMDDQPTYDLMKEARTTAVFQLESRGMKDLIRRLKPDTFEDIVALVALFRPGPLESGMVGDFIERKHGRNDPLAPPIDYLHPSLQPVLAPTYGVILYQEQVMQIAQVLAGYTLGGADMLRRAMGKKKPEEMAKERGKFVGGAVKNQVPEAQAAHIFDLMEKFAGYGFNKSHSAAYALLSYQTAWLKRHEAASYMAAVLSADMDHTDKVVGLLYDCRKEVGLTILPPHVNLSSYEFAVVDDKTIRYGLGAIKGVGQGAVDAIVDERRANGDFASLEDLCRRLDLSKVNRRVLEALIRSGSLDGLAANRATLMHRLDAALALGEQNTKANETGQHDIFGLSTAHVPEAVRSRAPDQAEWTDAVRLRGERETLGRAISGHPIDRFVNDLPRFITGRIVDYLEQDKPQASPEGGRSFFGGKAVAIAGVLEDLRKRGPRTEITLDDDTGRMQVSFFDEQYQQFRELLVKDALLLIEGKVRFDEFANTWVLRANKVSELERLREKEARRIVLKIRATDAKLLAGLQTTLTPYRGGACHVAVQYYGAQARGTFSFGADWKVRPAPALLEDLEKLFGRGCLAVLYSPPPQLAAESGAGSGNRDNFG
ncbi:MAG TPA: DNA polymerase III subunit alpha [Steroidobacteraceae bacterium]|nr:DNA polymerase III subunit alpha [Steroidobacteraceae bacterium]